MFRFKMYNILNFYIIVEFIQHAKATGNLFTIYFIVLTRIPNQMKTCNSSNIVLKGVGL